MKKISRLKIDGFRRLRAIDLPMHLSVAISRCSELKALVNTIISACGGSLIP